MSAEKREAVFSFHTAAAAILAEKALEAEGLAVRVMPLPDAIGAGCGICLRVDEPLLPAAAAALERQKIETAGVYVAQRVEGRMRYSQWNP